MGEQFTVLLAIWLVLPYVESGQGWSPDCVCTHASLHWCPLSGQPEATGVRVSDSRFPLRRQSCWSPAGPERRRSSGSHSCDARPRPALPSRGTAVSLQPPRRGGHAPHAVHEGGKGTGDKRHKGSGCQRGAEARRAFSLPYRQRRAG